jgi:nucleotide-binding universal stress UspA family protein
MPGIVCAIRGGLASRPTIDKAISLAEDTGLPLYFLYVVNLDFLTHTTSSRVSTISKELHQMGDFILVNAQTRAEAQGISAQRVVRHGNVSDEIVSLSRDIGANYVLLGNPRGEHDQDVFDRQRLENFIQNLEAESGAQVIVVEPDGNGDQDE